MGNGQRRLSTVCAGMALASLSAFPCVAEERSQVPLQNGAGTDADQSIESARGAVRSAAVWLASGVDSWFGSKPFSDGGKVVDGQVSLNLYNRQDTGGDSSVRFNARFKLPNLEEKTYLFTGQDNWQGVITDSPAAFSAKQQLLQKNTADSRSLYAGVGQMLSASTDARIGFRDGLKLFVQGRFHHLWKPSAGAEVEFSQTLFFTRLDHLGTSTTLSYEHHFSPTWVGRWLNAVTATQVEPDAQWNSSLGMFKAFGQQRLLSMELLASAKQNTGVALTDYGWQAHWEQPVANNRLIGELIVGHFWPQPTSAVARTTAWALGAGLKMRF